MAWLFFFHFALLGHWEELGWLYEPLLFFPWLDKIAEMPAHLQACIKYSQICPQRSRNITEKLTVSPEHVTLKGRQQLMNKIKKKMDKESEENKKIPVLSSYSHYVVDL